MYEQFVALSGVSAVTLGPTLLFSLMESRVKGKSGVVLSLTLTSDLEKYYTWFGGADPGMVPVRFSPITDG